MNGTGIYLRISQAKDEDDTLGVDRQRHDCDKVVRREGLDVAQVYTDNDRSAFNGKPRPEFTRMLADLKAGHITSVVGWANDRLYRRVEDQLLLMRAVAAAGGQIYTVKDGVADPNTAEGEMRMTILASVGQFESRRKSERVTAKMAEMARDGRTNGGGERPYGYDKGGLMICEPEAAIIREAARRFIDGETIYTIVNDLRARGITTGKGGVWRYASMTRILKS